MNMNWKPLPSNKAAGVDSFLTNLTGSDRKASVKNKVCVFCKEDVAINSFKDELSFREFHISGMCQTCQDSTFNL